jgi:hypothetical protein
MNKTRVIPVLLLGGLFVFMGPHRAVMINYPERKLLADRLP